MKQLLLTALIAIASTAMADPVLTLDAVRTSGPDQNAFAASKNDGGGNGEFGEATPQKLVFNHGITTTAGQDYFVIRLKDPIYLENPGDSITLKFSAIATHLRNIKGTDQAFRFGIFDIGKSAAEDFHGASGYRVSFGRGDSALGIYKRHPGKSGNLWTAAGRLKDPQGTAPVESFAINFGSTDILSAVLTMKRIDAKSVQISVTGPGNNESEIVDANGLKRFNAISFFLWKGTTKPATFTLADLELSVTQAR